MSKTYSVGDKIEEVSLKTKNREITVYKDNKITNCFKSLHETALFFKVSETTISNYIKFKKSLNGCSLKEKVIRVFKNRENLTLNSLL